MRVLGIQDVEYIAKELSGKAIRWNEPKLDFSLRQPGALETCLKNAFQPQRVKIARSMTLADRAAVMFYSILKEHPFLNGNKRIAATSLLIFLDLNDKWLSVDADDLYELAASVEKSNPELKAMFVSNISDFVQNHLVDFATNR